MYLNDYRLYLYVRSPKSQSKSFLFEIASLQYHFLINVLHYSKQQYYIMQQIHLLLQLKWQKNFTSLLHAQTPTA